MKIVIAGAGRIGGSVAKVLVNEGHDVTVIDRDEDTVARISGDIDASCMVGSASDIDILSDAGCAEADLFISATESDEVNLVSSICAKKLGSKYIIARIRDIEYSNRIDFLKDTFGLYVVINPELECAKEISRILRFPGASRVLQFPHGNAEVAQYIVPKSSILIGKTLADLSSISSAKIIIGLLTRGKEILIPDGSTEFKENDCLYIISTQKNQRLFFSHIGAYKKPVKNVMIMGGTTIAVYLAKALTDVGIDVSIVEKDEKTCSNLASALDTVNIISGDGMDRNVLLEEGISSSDAFVALTSDEGDNLITSLYAKDLGVDNVVTKIDHAHFYDVIKNSGIDNIVVPKKVVCDQIIGTVRAIENSIDSPMEALHQIADGRADCIEFILPENYNPDALAIKDMKIQKNILICALSRTGRMSVPDGNTVLKPKDAIVVMAPAGTVFKLEDISKHD